MGYITQDDLVPLRLSLGDLAELTSDSGDDPDPAVVQAAIDQASATVDGYCGQRYKTPLQASVMVKAIACDLAIYILASKRRETKPSETWSDNRNMAMKLLRDVADGKASLDQPATAVTQQTSSGGVLSSCQGHTFDSENTRGFC